MTEQLNIAELRRLHEAATPGKWHYDDGVTDGEGTADAERGKPAWITAKGNVLVAEPSGSDSQEACVPTLAQMDANGRFIEKSHNTLPSLIAALEEARAERDRMRDVLLRNNFAPCDTQACNCNGWHERATGDGFYARFREIDDAIGDHNGKTLLAAVVEMVQERDALKARLDEASRKVQEMCERIGRIHIADYVTESVEVCEGLDRIRAVLLDSRDMDALLRIIHDSFLSLNNPTSTLAFDGRNLVPHVEDASRYAEILRLERDALKGSAHTAFVMGADWARYQITQCTSFPSERDEASAEAEKRFPYVPRMRIYEVLNKELTAERDALKAKLAALVKASQPFANDQGCDVVHHDYTDRHDQRGTCPVVARLRDALAAAKAWEVFPWKL